ncbi:unnamed protein product [Pleuronectes platessa]|uniref:Uncharacterized protein n=1 Tax=Pleuronectes platessa TaxID=8262 RepID=A0A9N7VB24_PLEPL|nr:unnamed protein product [Pleuronectes platessa]
MAGPSCPVRSSSSTGKNLSNSISSLRAALVGCLVVIRERVPVIISIAASLAVAGGGGGGGGGGGDAVSSKRRKRGEEEEEEEESG